MIDLLPELHRLMLVRWSRSLPINGGEEEVADPAIGEDGAASTFFPESGPCIMKASNTSGPICGPSYASKGRKEPLFQPSITLKLVEDSSGAEGGSECCSSFQRGSSIGWHIG